MSEFNVLGQNGLIGKTALHLQENGYYKSFSLNLANDNRIPIPDTLIILSKEALGSLEPNLSLLGRTVMLRMDYAHINRKKHIGGIPVYTYSSLQRLCAFLFKHQYIPVLQTYINRFENKFSINCYFESIGDTLNIEIVGKGFDAGDLRLGLLNPHEIISFDFNYWKIKKRKIIGKDEYKISKNLRSKYIGKMSSYIEYVNREHELLYDINNFAKQTYSNSVNDEYEPVTKKTIDDISFLAYTIRKKIAPQLPGSKAYVASFSMLKNGELALWDIYGEWYYR